jgi:hypothetical protein
VDGVSSYFCSLYFPLILQHPSPQSWCSPPWLFHSPTCNKTELQITRSGFEVLIFPYVNDLVKYALHWQSIYISFP